MQNVRFHTSKLFGQKTLLGNVWSMVIIVYDYYNLFGMQTIFDTIHDNKPLTKRNVSMSKNFNKEEERA